jgi:hypothetical protein
VPDLALKEQVVRDSGGRFARGHSGNPAGRPVGCRDRVTRAVQELLDGDAGALTRKAVEMALDGHMSALKLCLDRILAPQRERPVAFAMPAIRGAGDLGPAMAAIAAAASRGTVTPGEAVQFSQLVETYVRAAEATEFDRRLRALETNGAASP